MPLPRETAITTGTLPTGAERRTHERAPWPINKTLQGELYLASAEPEVVYLHVVDLSTGGIGLTMHRELPQDTEFSMKLPLDGFGTVHEHLEFRCRVAWQKPLLGGTWSQGLRFTGLDELAEQALGEVLTTFSLEGRLRRYRFNRMLPVAIRERSGQTWMAERYAVNLTLDKVEIRLDHPLEPETRLEVRLALEFGMPSLMLAARVKACEQTSGTKHQVELEFEEPTLDDQTALRTYLERCLKAR